MGFLSRLRSHAQQHVVAYIALAIVVSGGTAYAANEWTGANIVDDSLTAADLDESTLGLYDTGVVRVNLPAVGQINNQTLLTVEGNRFFGGCANRPQPRGPNAALRVRPAPGTVAGTRWDPGSPLTPFEGEGSLEIAFVSAHHGPPLGDATTVAIMSDSDATTATGVAALGLNGTNDCYFSLTIP